MKSEGVTGLCCWLALLITSCILFGCSFSTLDLNHVGLKFNSITRRYSRDKILGPGRYFLGLGFSIVPFPTIWDQISYCKGCADGNAIVGRVGVGSSAVSVHVSMKVYYKLRIEKLSDIINFFPTLNWRTRYVTIVKNAVVTTIGSSVLTLEDFISNRAYVAKTLAWAMNDRLLPVYGYVTAIYLGAFVFGSALDSPIERVYLNQQISNRRAITSAVQGSTQVVEAQAQQNVSAIIATERKLLDDTFRITNFTVMTYTAEGEIIHLDAEGQGYLYLQSALNFTQTDLLKFVYLDKVIHQASNIVTGFNKMRFDSTVQTIGGV